MPLTHAIEKHGRIRRSPSPRVIALGAVLVWLMPMPAPGASGVSATFTLDTRIFATSGTYVLGTGVIGILGDTGAGSLRDSIAGATSGDTLTFDPPLDGMMITLGGTQFTLGKNLTITAAALPNGIALSGGNASRVFEILSGNTIILNNLIVSDGNAAGGSGGGILNSGGVLSLINSDLTGNAAISGGAIHNSGSLFLTNATLTGNSSVAAGGAVYNNGGFVTLSNLLLSGNTAGTGGGGIHNNNSGGTVKLTNATLTGNTAGTDGGGIQNSAGTVTLISVTLSGNHATGLGGGLDLSGQMNIENTIVAANTGPAPGNGRDIRVNGAVVVKGANLIGNNDTAGFNFPAAPPLVGTPASPVAPLLAALGDYGGLMPTMALLAGSPAIDSGGVTGSTPPTDQRGPGFARVRGGVLDIGAYESGNEAGYTIWALERIPTGGDSSFGGDVESDGSKNGNEYAHKLNPVVSDNALHPVPVLVDNGGALEMRVTFPFRPDARDLIYIVERSGDIENFSEIYRYDSSTGFETITSPPVVDATLNVGAMEIEVVDTDTAGPRVFWRLRTELIVP